MSYQVRFITRSVKRMVTMRWVMAWLENGFGCSMKDERTCTMIHEMSVHLWWMMIWCVRSTRVHDDRRFTISDLSLHFPQISRTLLCDNVSSHVGYRKVCARWVPKTLTEEHKKTAYCMCFDISNALSQGRRRHVEPYCDRRRDMGVP